MEFNNGFLLSLSLCLDIGLANMAMITLAIQRGFSQGVWLGIGTCVGDLIYAILAMAGMAVLLQFEVVRWGLWIGGSAVLCYLSAKMLISTLKVQSEMAEVETQGGVSNLTLFSRGMFLAISSPSAILWFAAVGGPLSLARVQMLSVRGFSSRVFSLRAWCGLWSFARWLIKAER